MSHKALLGFLLGASLAGRLGAQISVDSVLATNLLEPVGVVAMTDGTIYVSDGANDRVVKFSTGSGELRVLAGLTGTPGSSSGMGTRARFNQLEGIVLDPVRGGLVVADSYNQLIRFVSFEGVVTNLAGRVGERGAEDGALGVARFRYPLGLAADGDGNIFIADSKNNAIRKLSKDGLVTTLSTNFFEPAAVAVGAGGVLWVADTRNNAIKLIDTNGVVTLVAGSTSGVAGYLDGLLAADSRFNSPRGLFWLGGKGGLLISDGGNNVIRRLFFNPEILDYSVETFAGVAGPGGFLNGPALSALLSAPVGLCSDLNGGVMVADRANQQIRRINTGPQQPPVADPVIGWVQLQKDSFGSFVTALQPVQSGVFNNPVVIAIRGEAGTQTYFTYGPSPALYEDTIPVPGPLTGLSAPFYQDGRPASEMPSSILDPEPDVTIKAIGTQDGRRSSAVVMARFQFKVGNPVVQGDNAAYFTLDTCTAGAEMWYTLDGSDPTNSAAGNPNVRGPIYSGDVLSLVVQEADVLFKVRGFKPNFKPSEVSSRVFSPSNFVANAISFGFDGGEASSVFRASAGQRFYAPVTLSALPTTKIYSLQFNVTVTNLDSALSPDGGSVAFRSMLLKPVDQNTYMVIPPAMAIKDGSAVYTNLLFTNISANLLGVGWLERATHTNLYDTLHQDLITYSQAHDTLFLSKDGKVVLGGYSFVVPKLAADGQSYRIQIGQASGTADGVAQDVYIALPTNGSMRAVQTVVVEPRSYLVGDVAPFRWFNAGDFGNTNLLNSDVLQAFQSAVYRVNMPPAGSDFYDAMDSCCWDENHNSLPSAALFSGDDTIINSVVFGDGNLNVADVFVTFRRSLDPSLKWFARYWSGGERQYLEVPNPLGGTAGAASPAVTSHTAKGATDVDVRLTAAFSADDVVSGANRTVQVPVRVGIAGPALLRVLMLNLTVQPLEGSPALTQGVQFSPAPGLGTPTMSMARSPGNFAAAWLDNTVAGVGGDSLLGTLTITLPDGVPATGVYRIHFDHISASPNGLALFACQVTDGLVTVSDRSASSWQDGIPDSWRLKYFGSVSDPLSAATVDADGDGVPNLAEYLAGTNPTDSVSRLRLSSYFGRWNNLPGVRLEWPTSPNRRYVLECSTNFSGGGWRAMATNIVGTGALGEYIDAGTGSGARFYRLRVVE